ncbi:hypothetical protein [Clostridium intestinale]|uniref:hypothetical protein n=1 Tax=Clostridium intestinale TaxID=36845 RepID=UPI002DD62030|nr:hypothetical protein [Clostridium intestinale]WRY49772.1 hypothetical protein P8F83_13670 [Clostridium intestinale]
MKEDELKKSFENLKPSYGAKQRMLVNVLNNSNDKTPYMFIYAKRAIPLLILVLVFGGTLVFYNLNKKGYVNDDFIIEDNIARVTNQFKIENKTYNILSEGEKAEFKFPNTINNKDIGDKLTTISTSVDESLIGKEVYRYIPAGCDGIVAVKVDNEYKLFKFFWFDSYINNKDEDTKAYLELYGINKGEDISKIQFIKNGNSIINEITDKSRILEFYNYYSIIPDSSDKYFNKLFNYKKSKEQVVPEVKNEPKELPPDYKDNTSSSNTITFNNIEEVKEIQIPIEVDMIMNTNEIKDTQNSTPSYEGSVGDALGNSVTIRIYNQKGVYFTSEYYPNISFISRHEVNADFKKILDEYVK